MKTMTCKQLGGACGEEEELVGGLPCLVLTKNFSVLSKSMLRFSQSSRLGLG